MSSKDTSESAPSPSPQENSAKEEQEAPLISPTPAASGRSPSGSQEAEEEVTEEAVAEEGEVSPACHSERSEESQGENNEEWDPSAMPQDDSKPLQEEGAAPETSASLPSPKGECGAAMAATDEGGSPSSQASETKKGKVKPSSVVFVVLSSIICLMAVFIFVVSFVARLNGTQPEFFGFSFSIVLTDSMTPEIEVGELVVVKSCDISEVADAYNEDGEKLNIVFISRSGTLEGERIVHKVYSVNVDENGEIYIQTKGEKEGAPVDSEYVRSDNFVGVAVYHSIVLGGIISFLSKAQNWIIIAILVGLVIFAVKQIKKIVKYAKDGNEEKKE